MADLTSEQEFIVKRLRMKVTAAKHHLGDAVLAARSTSREVLAQAGMREAVKTLKGYLGDLEVVLYPPTTPVPPTSEELPHG